ncbi:DUF805 domain-containing protein [Flavobacterium sp. DG1-102-2]|uniref:DUF805 domain-containing protein n=1 Tax=Flavobacterium sp. DG1-102-2 TaxID=3081663 RepID=UPI002949933B|nr:DUF805 domain-containing protein [Flavobacterium sp. DG1-102-2]MDV6167570.1 DUF805 domain-containing protein [Flavobacterium sp. DG1-102-2]
MIDWYLKVVRDNYANFSGRARRSEYWYYALCNFLISLVLQVVDYFIGFGLLGGIYGLAVLVPGLAVFVRRLHDVNKSGWFILLLLLPVIGWIWLLVLLFTEGTVGPNQYGEDPKRPYSEFDQIGKEETF